MKKFYTLFSAALMATAAIAAPATSDVAKQRRGFDVDAAHQLSEKLAQHKLSKSDIKATALEAFGTKDADSKVYKKHKSHAKSPKKVAAPSDAAIVEEAPDGTQSWMSRNSQAYLVFWGYVFMADDEGLAVNKVEASDGKVWFRTPLSQYPTGSYIYGTVEGNTLTIPGGQPIAQEWMEDENGDEVLENLYVVALEYMEDEDGAWYGTGESIDYKLTITEDGYVSANPDQLLALTWWDEETQDYWWLGYGDYDMTITAQTDQLVELPADAVAEKWAMIQGDGNGHMVKVATSGSDVYVQGMYTSCPDAWVKLSVEDEEAIMASGQYLGNDIDTWHYAYAYGGKVEQVYDDYWEEYVDQLVLKDDLVFGYDAAAKVLSSEEAFAVTPVGTNPSGYVTYMDQPYIHHEVRIPGTPPANPTDVYTPGYESDYGNGYLNFNVPIVDTNGCLLDSNCLYYRLYVDDEVYTFEKSDYEDLPETTMTEIPWGFDDNWDFYNKGAAHTLYYYFDGADALGIQSVYYDPEDDNKELVSEVVNFRVTALKSVGDNGKAVDSTLYYDLQGRRISGTDKGIAIRVTKYTDGSKGFSKVVR